MLQTPMSRSPRRRLGWRSWSVPSLPDADSDPVAVPESSALFDYIFLTRCVMGMDRSYLILISFNIQFCCVVAQFAPNTEVKPLTDTSLRQFHRQKELLQSVKVENVTSELHDRNLRSISDFHDDLYRPDKTSNDSINWNNVRHLMGVTDTRRSKCELDPLPVDLISNNGGSKKYGGPQQRNDGSIEFFGAIFALPRRQDGEAESQVETGTPLTPHLFPAPPHRPCCHCR
jgi:hypothetical protein